MSKTDESDDEIPMPEGPPPGSQHIEKDEDGEEDDSDDDIPLPEGPPPPKPLICTPFLVYHSTNFTSILIRINHLQCRLSLLDILHHFMDSLRLSRSLHT